MLEYNEQTENLMQKSLHAIPFLEFLNIYTHVRKTVSAILPDLFSSYGECCICAAVLHCLRVDCMTVWLSYLEVIPCHCPWWQDIQEVICYSLVYHISRLTIFIPTVAAALVPSFDCL